ncbi:MFS transporter [Kocuria palustris]|jgi:MHS family proline/betaine transporter-like MFS transporter|uniref:MFS transporter n=1 Tax=Kocuria palustris TaxID=71999 RepID=UPI0019CFD64D|nr:MFS transporter [Kocuria palustris]MBN6752885.1 MFS transporter [Kocuria palustris]MBN6757880.1 MFS transporter [Kocuria palustris]MBN6762908.1 MFS transporter [Kocuria palustris]MBN6782551.1 MFS transporter [Kocuria palustris]MBN6799307.1 MFS transporter [Kocuria palustris]
MSSSQAGQDPGPQRDPSAHDADHQPAAPDAGTVHRAVAASAIGNATEWFDYGVYAVSVGYITHNFFPGEYGTVLALATFAFSFLVRPLGGLFWGPLGDRLGRKAILALTIILMAGATFCIGLLPSFETIGVLAPILLIVLRAVQGFSTGGEYGGAATFMAEYAPDRKRGFLGSFLEFGTMGGFALGSLIVLLGETFLGHDGMMEWGWRIPFLIAGPMGLIGMYLRSKLGETPVFEEAEELDATQDSALGGLKDLLTGYWRPILTMAGLVIAVNVVNYTLLSYMPTYLEGTGGMEYQTVLTISFVTQFGMMLLIPFAGSLSDRLGRKPVWRISLVGLIVMSVPMYMLMSQGVWGTLIGISVLGLLYVLQLATISATFPAMFPTKVRFAGFAITYNVSTSLFGGTAPSVNEALIEATGSPLVPAFYMVAACIVGLIAVHFMKETVGASLRGNDIPETGPQEIVRIRAGKA